MDQHSIKAKEFAKKWAGIGQENQHTEKFWFEFLEEILDVKKPYEFFDTQKPAYIGEKNYGYLDGYIKKSKVIIEQKSHDIDLFKREKQSNGEMLTAFEQAERYNRYLVTDEKAKYIITCNFDTFVIYDMTKPRFPYKIIYLKDLEKEYYQFEFLVKDIEFDPYFEEKQISVEAGKLIGKLYNAILGQCVDKESVKTLKSLNILLVRIVFCLFAEDAGLFKKNQFTNLLENTKTEEINSKLVKLFEILATKKEERGKYEDKLILDFPYVNGGLFEKKIDIPYFTDDIKLLIVNDCGKNFNWENINPTIFGAVFESTLNPEIRRSGGMHYTSLENIHRVIYPLFMNDLEKEFNEIKNVNETNSRKAKLRKFREKLGTLRFFDPACGSGNFLTESFTLLRDLENRVLNVIEGREERAISFKHSEEFLNLKVNIHQFYGIEINDFAVSVAKTALWIAEWQMLRKTLGIINENTENYLPLKTYNNIYEGNALKADWDEVIGNADKERGIEYKKVDYIMGNPPFVGARLMSQDQKDELNVIFDGYKNIGNLDYVTCWYKKSCDYIKGTDIQCALVSSNSITQGEQVAILWKPLIDNYTIKINFAYTTFEWDNESTAKGKAAVYCVIVGFSQKETSKKYLYDENNNYLILDKINGYLIDGEDIYIESREHPICDVPEIGIGNKPIDDGNYLFTEDEMKEFIKKEPKSEKYFKKWIGADEFINRYYRYCLLLKDCSAEEIKSMPLCFDRVKNVKNFRLNSKSAPTRKLAERPLNFHVENIPISTYIVIPETSSERRKYIPIGFVEPEVLSSNAIRILPNATLYHFGVLTSSAHMSWMRTVAGRLKSDYRYSKDIVYNNFPWPEATKENIAEIEKTAQGILDVRNKYPNESLASLYDPDMMKLDLKDAHIRNDRAVLKAYGVTSKMEEYHDDKEFLKFLFKLYKEKNLNLKSK